MNLSDKYGTQIKKYHIVTPMHIVIICFPLQHAFLKNPSILKAILGKYPKSSKMVKRGKKIAIGGSITAIIHVNVWYIPYISILEIQVGQCI